MFEGKRKRFFNRRERITLFLHSAGMCRICGAELEPGWHSDHVTAFSRGGATELANGQALCARCNLKKSDHETVSENK